ncbi:hypothetical protein COCSADRAFT_38036 [Bipolaris sorokiniana ND90Pr]|uniref:Uncharacterized protein n=1 Tax=Cochliobolus sativus (strain ND90Pr / ATCC 201652) TaxID=665912 RepID=M2T1T6_COCSN|nr:uncharacterized protein COCSADRAFT_38036 [Bipolaris sorokiniana ND90Pr]EMD63156.1 hypothetical protein COCSADRAFT_38036 [Bipolaris sorokiniana ND90Pr]
MLTTLPIPHTLPVPAIPMQWLSITGTVRSCPRSSRRPPPTATCRTHPRAAETNASSSPAVSNTLDPSTPRPLFSSLPAILFPIPRFPLALMTYPVSQLRKHG